MSEREKKASPVPSRGLMVAGVAAIVVVIALLIWIFGFGGLAATDPDAQSGQAPYKSEERMQAEADRQLDEGIFNISIASTIQFADGTSPGTAYIENVPGNRYNMRVVIVEDGSGQVLYESGVLAPDQFIEDIVLAHDLDAGTYNATATFTALDQASGEERGQVNAKIAINVLG